MRFFYRAVFCFLSSAEAKLLNGAGIFKQTTGARNRVAIELSYQPARATQPAGVGSLESILRLLKS